MSDRQDVITAEIIRNYLETVSQEISATVENTAMSPIFTMNHDYSCGVFYWDGLDVQILARDMAVPVHIFATLDSVRMLFKEFGADDIHEGDIFLVTDPYLGGTHCPDWTIIKPLHVGGRPAFFPCVRGHVNDVGGPVPGNYNVHAREVWQEGFRISPVRIVDRGRPVRDLWEVILANTRLPHEVRGDLMAMVGATTVGERRIRELMAKFGPEVVEASVDHILRYSEVQIRAEIARWPDGVYRATEYVDHDFAGHHDIPIHVTVTIAGDELTVDFTGSSPQVPGFINSPPGNSLSQVFTAFTAMCPDIPVNSGFFRPIHVVLPEGSIVNPRAPAPVGHCTLVPGSTMIEAVMKAFEPVVPRLVGNAACDLNSVVSFGTDPEGRYWLGRDMNTTPMSAGGAYGTDGWGAWAATFCALRLPPMELLEAQYPYCYVQAEYAPDTAAPGRWRGAPAVRFRRRNLGPMRVTIYNAGYRNPLAGFAGGHRGAGNYYVIREGLPDEMRVTDLAYAESLPAGSHLASQSGGGGGWGDPLDRDAGAVLDDWLDELVSLEAARREYGVVIDLATRAVDAAATLRLRAELRERRRGGERPA
jgi:N-methylhydantoinase B